MRSGGGAQKNDVLIKMSANINTTGNEEKASSWYNR